MLGQLENRMPGESEILRARQELCCDEASSQPDTPNSNDGASEKKSFWRPTEEKWWILALFFIAFSIYSRMCDVSPAFVVTVMLWVAMVVYAFRDLYNRAAYLIFLLSFFLFLLGGEFFELYLGYRQEFNFVEKLDIYAHYELLISLVFLQAGYWGADLILSKKKKSPQKLKRRDDPACLQQLQRFSKVCLYITAVPLYITTLDAVLYTVQNGYLSYYTTFQSRVPAPVEMVGELFPMFFFLYLAGFPSKKDCMLPLAIYLAHGCLAVLTGRRISLGVAVLVLMFYVLLRHCRSKEEKWINRKIVTAVAIGCPVVILVLYVQRYLRYGQDVEGGGLLDMAFRFFTQQGGSSAILKLQKEVEGDPLGCTSLYYTLHYLRGNIITRHFFDFPMEQYVGRTVERALNTNCLADYIMYKVDANDFFAGYGLGTSYIAELNHDLGFAGIALGSALYGFLLNWLYAPKHFTYWKFALGLMMLEEFVILPRYGADVILRPFYNFTRSVALIGLFVLVILGKERVQWLTAKFGIDKLFRAVQKHLPTDGVKRRKGADDADKEC